MGIREEKKLQTRNLIIKKTEELLFKNGLVKVSTKEISSNANVAQGSIFLHFTSKENLLHIIISEGISKLNVELSTSVNVKNDSESFLSDIIDSLSLHENMLSRVYKDYHYLGDTLKKDVDQIETLIKNMFFDNVRESLGNKLSIVDSFIAIDAFMAQIKQNLLEKEVYTEFSSVLRQRKGKLTKLYRRLFA